MNFYFTHHFKKQLKQLIKKYPNAKTDLIQTLKNLDPNKQTQIKANILKIRIKSSDKNSGKSAGFRSYIYLYKQRNLIVPLTIYSKSHKENLSTKGLNTQLSKTIQELTQTLH